MNILALAQADGLKPKKISSSKGGEYHSPCPGCGGKDRFIIWDKLNRYYCRQCQRRGDPIQYLRDFHSLSYKQACERLHISPKSMAPHSQLWKPTPTFVPQMAKLPSSPWREQAYRFIKLCHLQLMKTTPALYLLFERGLTLGTIQLFQLGWNAETVRANRSEWDLSEQSNKKLWLPKGLVIPTLDAIHQVPIKLKIRRDDWHERDKLAKYVEIPGSMQTPSIYGTPSNKPLLILESEFDAILVQQYAGDICRPIALGGASKRPDIMCDQLLTAAPLVLFALDVDQGGAAAFRWWRKVYPSIILWPPPIGKSPGDAFKQGIDLRKWIVEGLRMNLHK